MQTTIREAFEMHELLMFKNISATKTSAMMSLVKDEELKALMDLDFRLSVANIRELKGMVQPSEAAPKDGRTDYDDKGIYNVRGLL